MTCYFSLLKNVFDKAQITVTKENRKEIDIIINSIVGVEYSNCPTTWKAVKKRLTEDEDIFVNKLREAFFH